MTTTNLVEDLEGAHARGMQWGVIAGKAGISTAALRLIRTGQTNPRPETVAALRRAIDPSTTLTARSATGQVIIVQLKTPLPDAQSTQLARILQATADAFAEGV